MKDLKNISDTQLVELLLNRNEDAILYFFYQKYYSVFERQVYRIFHYKVDVQELVHELFVYLFKNDCKHLRSYNSSKSKLNTWLSTVSYYFFLDYKKRKIDYNGRISIYEQWDDRIMQYKQDAHSQLKMDVIKAINGLKNKTTREVARRLLIDEDDPKDIAAELGLTVDYVYTLKSRALERLRKILKDYRS